MGNYNEMFSKLQQIVRSLDSESIEIDELEDEIEKAYKIVDELQTRLQQTSLKVESIIQIKESNAPTNTETAE